MWKTISIATVLWVFGPAVDARLVGLEFPVNSHTTSDQEQPAVALDAAGNFVVAWQSDLQDGSGYGVFGQRFDAAANPLGGEFAVTAGTLDDQKFPSVAAASSGSFVVVWEDRPSADPWAPMGRRFDATGTPLGGDFQINNETVFTQFAPRVAADAAGAFVVSWTGYGDKSTTFDIFARRFSAAGTPLGDQFMVNADTAGIQLGSAVARSPAGDFVVAWAGSPDGGGNGVSAQLYDASGNPLGGNFQVNTYTSGSQGEPSVAIDATGGFVVAWYSEDQDGSGDGVFARRYDAAGDPLGGEIPVNSYTTSDQRRPSVAPDGAGFVVVWDSVGQDGSGAGVFGQRFDAAGAPIDGEFQVNSYTTTGQSRARIGAGGAGGFAIVWESEGQDGDGLGVFGQRYSTVIFADGFESGDTSAWSSTTP